MKWETKVLREIPETDGTLTDETGSTVEVRFTLTQTQDFIDGIPTLRSAHGTIEFRNTSEGWRMFNSSAKKTLKGGGIVAEVFVASLDTFRVAGPVNDI